MRRRLALLVPLVLACGLLAAGEGAQGAAATCRGLPVTIEGTPGATIEGTPGPDVILAPYGSQGGVFAGTGDDVVCVVPAPPEGSGREPHYLVDGGDGDDVIDSTSLPADHPLEVPMNPGSDAFYGGPEADDARGLIINGETNQDVDADVFVTGAGDDSVSSGTQLEPNADQIDLGEGDDTVTYSALRQGAGGFLVTGSGADILDIAESVEDPRGGALSPGALVVDAVAGQATLGGTPYLSWSGDGFRSFDFSAVDNRLTFVGTDAAENLVLSNRRVDVRMGGGDDAVGPSRYAIVTGRLVGRLDGGDGRDRVRFATVGTVAMDLRDEVVLRAFGLVDRLGLAAFEIATVRAYRSAELRGTRGPDRLSAFSRGDIKIVGRGGDDILVMTAGRHAKGQRTAMGGSGDDRLFGSRRGDTLVGGVGQDTAMGDDGRDLCRAEVRVGCELP